MWHNQHVYFKQLLKVLRKEVDAFHSGTRPNYALIVDIVTYLRQYADQFHHPREDVAFVRLAKHCPDMDLMLARLDQEHRVIAHAGEALLELVNKIVDGAVLRLDEVEAAAAPYLVYYGNHIAKEEEDVLGVARQMLTPEDWDAVKNAVPPSVDPLFGDHPEARFKALHQQIAREATAR